METGKVIVAIKTDRSWDSGEKGYGIFDIYKIAIDQGDERLEGTTMVKQGSECKFKEGQEAQFTKQEDTYAKDGSFKFKWASETKAWGGGGGRQPENPKIRNVSMSMSYAKDLVCAGKVEMNSLLNTAELMLEWMDKRTDIRQLEDLVKKYFCFINT